MTDSFSRERVSSLSDDELIGLLRAHQCELFIGQTGRFSLRLGSNESESVLLRLLIRETFRRRVQLTPFARVNGIRLRGIGEISAAA